MTRRPTPPQDRDLPRDQQTIPKGSNTRCWAPTYDYTFRFWRWPATRPAWVGKPRDRQRSWVEDRER